MSVAFNIIATRVVAKAVTTATSGDTMKPAWRERLFGAAVIFKGQAGVVGQSPLRERPRRRLGRVWKDAPFPTISLWGRENSGPAESSDAIRPFQERVRDCRRNG
jgi:hypothetical protein